jgi:hypothetical protein
MPLRKTIAVIVRASLVDWASPQKASNPFAVSSGCSLSTFVWLFVEHKVSGTEDVGFRTGRSRLRKPGLGRTDPE